jgi:hypothetical protein
MVSCRHQARLLRGELPKSSRRSSGWDGVAEIRTNSFELEANIGIYIEDLSESEGEDTRNPSVLRQDVDAEMVTCEWRYIPPIFLDSISQSSLESWIIQRESIQRYLRPNWRVTTIACRKFAGRILKSMEVWNGLSVSVLRSGEIYNPRR